MTGARDPAAWQNLWIAGLFGVGILALPAIETAGILLHDFHPDHRGTSIAGAPLLWMFLHGTLVAWGALRTRPRPGREDIHRLCLAPLLVQAVIWALLVAVVLPIARLGGGMPSLELGDLYMVIAVYWFVGGWMVAGLQFFCSRNTGVLFFGQIVPFGWMAYIFISGRWVN